MASFRTHFSLSAVTGGLAATSLLVVGAAAPGEVLLYFVAATLGGILPDIDSDTSTPLTVGFTLFAVVFSFLAVFSLGHRYAVLELALIWLAVFLLVRLVLFRWFTVATAHRGIIHSLPAAAAFGLGTVILLHQWFGHSPRVAWLAGGFLSAGFLLHLLLDELASLNLLGWRAKHSLGSAFKLFSHDLRATAFTYALAVGLFLAAPPWQGVVGWLGRKETWEGIRNSFFPLGGWFGWGG